MHEVCMYVHTSVLINMITTLWRQNKQDSIIDVMKIRKCSAGSLAPFSLFLYVFALDFYSHRSQVC